MRTRIRHDLREEGSEVCWCDEVEEVLCVKIMSFSMAGAWEAQYSSEWKDKHIMYEENSPGPIVPRAPCVPTRRASSALVATC